MGDEIKQLTDMLAKLKMSIDEGFSLMNNKFDTIDKRFDTIDKRFDTIDKRFDDVENAILELNTTQVKILKTIKLQEHDINNNRRHIEKFEERENYI